MESRSMQREVSGSWNEGEIPLHTYQNGYSYTDVLDLWQIQITKSRAGGGGGEMQETGSPGTWRQERKVAEPHLKMIGNWFEN